MDDQVFWIVEGRRLAESAGGFLSDDVETARFNYDGAVKVKTSRLGTEIKWSVFSPCFASLFYAMNWLSAARAPVILQFYLSGWFEETFHTVEEAINRIEQVMAKSELHLTKRAFVEEVDPTGKEMPPILQRTWSGHEVSTDTSIDFVFEEKSQKFRIDRIGSKSTIAKFYGMSPVSYPYVNGGSYDDIVYEAYTHVLRSGKPRYDHVLAAMRMPDNVIRWMPYQRIVVPGETSQKLPCVSVVTEIANVIIRPV
jgi:hypothetical protein